MRPAEQSTSNLYVLLAPLKNEVNGNTIKSDDMVLVAPWLNYTGTGEVIGCVDLSESQETTLAQQLACALNGLERHKNEALALSNDFYAYTLRPTVSLLATLKSIIDERSPARIHVVCSKRKGNAVPMYGFKTTENLRGSDKLFGAFIGTLIPATFKRTEFSYIYVPRDIFCFEPTRKLGLFLASTLLALKFSATAMLFGLKKSPCAAASQDQPLIIVRAHHQIRFASLLLDGFKQIGFTASVLTLPQFAFGGKPSVFYAETRKHFGQLCTHLEISDIIFAWVRGLARSIKLIFAKSQKCDFHVAGVQLTLDIASIPREMGLISFLSLYKQLLVRTVRRLKKKNVISFELVGQIAGLEAAAMEEIPTAKLSSIQTALISARPHVVFPFSERFYADSKHSAARLATIGAIKLGSTLFSGSPLNKGTTHTLSSGLARIAYFTQPYEHEITEEILATLTSFCWPRNIAITLRLHPRDNRSRYEKWGELQPSNLLSFDDSLYASSLLEQADLCVTRTSSVAKESIAMGTPIILCLWSALDRTPKADYLDKPLGIDYRCQEKAGLLNLLNNHSVLAEQLSRERERIFGEQNVRDLAADIVRLQQR